MNISPSRLYAAAVERQMGEIMRSNPNYIEDMQIGNPKVAKIWIEFIEKHPEICAAWRKMAAGGDGA
jgi:prephenate dehydrogenase